jgi:hypothetical protein
MPPKKQTIIKRPAGTGNISITIENNLKNTNPAPPVVKKRRRRRPKVTDETDETLTNRKITDMVRGGGGSGVNNLKDVSYIKPPSDRFTVWRDNFTDSFQTTIPQGQAQAMGLLRPPLALPAPPPPAPEPPAALPAPEPLPQMFIQYMIQQSEQNMQRENTMFNMLMDKNRNNPASKNENDVDEFIKSRSRFQREPDEEPKENFATQVFEEVLKDKPGATVIDAAEVLKREGATNDEMLNFYKGKQQIYAVAKGQGTKHGNRGLEMHGNYAHFTEYQNNFYYARGKYDGKNDKEMDDRYKDNDFYSRGHNDGINQKKMNDDSISRRLRTRGRSRTPYPIEVPPEEEEVMGAAVGNSANVTVRRRGRKEKVIEDDGQAGVDPGA